MPNTALRLTAPVLATALGAWTGLAAAAPADTARVVEVTVYPDRAEVTRELELDLPAGRSIVEFPRVPIGVDADSIRVRARGVPAILGAIEVRQVAGKLEEPVPLAAARDELRRIEGRIARLEADTAISGTLRGFLGSLGATTAAESSRRLVEGRVDPGSVAAIYDLIASRLEALADEETSRAQAEQDLERELQVARARLDAAQTKTSIVSRVAAVEVQVDTPGRLALLLAYVTPEASWRPSYRASLDPATGEIELVAEAVIRQATGEDWEGVKLSLSTASPALGVRPPELPPWLLKEARFGIEQLPVLGATYQDILTLAPGVTDSWRPNLRLDSANEIEILTSGASAEFSAAAGGFANVQEAGHAVVELKRSSYNVSFDPEGEHDLPSDGAEHRIVLRTETLPGEVSYRTVPGWAPRAYLVARTRAPAGYPLLAGPVRVLVSGTYVGSFHLEEAGPGEEITLPFGADSHVRVERVPLPESHRAAGVTGRDRQVVQAFRTIVENLRPHAVTVVVEDRLPVSEDERIRVAMGRETTPGGIEVSERPGVHEWTLQLAPGERRDVVLEYAIRSPGGIVIAGLD